MKLTGNKGEWCEFYAFLKIVCDRHLVSADENLNAIADQITKVIKAYRQEKSGIKVYDLEENNISIYSQSDTSEINPVKIGYVDYAALKSSVKIIFDRIKIEDGTFTVDEAASVMDLLHCSTIKAGNADKEDLKLVLDDYKNHKLVETGFSIKSDLGSPPTLLNASGATNFTYELKNHRSDVSLTTEINSIKGVQGRIAKIQESGAEICFSDVKNKTFFANLRRADSLLPQILAEFLLSYFKGEDRKISELTDRVAKTEAVQKMHFNKEDVKFKISQFLKHVALGMVPNKAWSGIQRADGGYIIVKDSGDLVCFHIHNLDRFMQYLFKNTKLDTPSTSRHKFGFVYEKNGRFFIDLNLQIRFI